MKIIGKECIFAPGSLTKTCHASTLVKLGDKIICAWFGGEGISPRYGDLFCCEKKKRMERSAEIRKNRRDGTLESRFVF